MPAPLLTQQCCFFSRCPKPQAKYSFARPEASVAARRHLLMLLHRIGARGKMCFGRALTCLSGGFARGYLAEFATHEHQGQGGYRTSAIGRASATHFNVVVASPAIAGSSELVSEIDTEPQRFVLTEAKPSSAPARSVPAERRYLGGVLHLLLVGLVAAAIIVAFFGSAFSVLIPPRDKAVLGAGLDSPAPHQAMSTVKVTTSHGDR